MATINKSSMVLSRSLPEEEKNIQEGLQELKQGYESARRGIYKAGSALSRVRDSKVYREKHPTFEAYVEERWGVSRQRAYQLIDAAEAIDNLLPEGTDVDDLVPKMLPSERQVRLLTKLTPEQQRELAQEVDFREIGLKELEIRVERKLKGEQTDAEEIQEIESLQASAGLLDVGVETLKLSLEVTEEANRIMEKYSTSTLEEAVALLADKSKKFRELKKRARPWRPPELRRSKRKKPDVMDRLIDLAAERTLEADRFQELDALQKMEEAEALVEKARSVLRDLVERAIRRRGADAMEVLFPDPNELQAQVDNEMAFRGIA